MELQDIKSGMMKLWKETFHDTDEYISLIFDEYFDRDYIEYDIKDGKIISALLAIPYKFGNRDNTIKAIYLCGLATDINFRGEGRMSNLINKICLRMKDKGYAFVFLIPADDGLIKYYQDRGFVDAFYKLEYNYLPHHNFKKDYFEYCRNKEKNISDIYYNIFENSKIYCLDRLIYHVSNDMNLYTENIYNINHIYNEIISFIIDIENSNNGLKIYLDNAKLNTIIKECIISGGKIFYCKDRNNCITSVLFSYISNNDIIINKIFSKYKNNCYLILDYISNNFPNSNIRIYEYESDKREDSIFNFYYMDPCNDENGNKSMSDIEIISNEYKSASVYGMARILNFPEILKFMTNETDDLKFSILMKDEKQSNYVRYDVNGEMVEENEISEDEVKKDPKLSSLVMSRNNFSALLFRRESLSSLLSEAFGFPPLNGEIYLMLD